MHARGMQERLMSEQGRQRISHVGGWALGPGNHSVFVFDLDVRVFLLYRMDWIEARPLNRSPQSPGACAQSAAGT